MLSLNFWKDWSRPYRVLYIVSLSLLLASLLAFLFTWWQGLGNVIRWDVLSELNEVPITLHTFTDGLLDYAVSGKAYAVSEQFVASAMQVRPLIATIFFIGICSAFALILGALTRLDRIRYLIGMGLVIAGLAFFRWEMLEVPGLGGQYLFMLLTFLFGSVSYYFHAFRPDLRFPIRVGVFAGLMAGVTLVIGTLSPVSLPAMTLVNYGLPVLLVGSAGFIFFIAFEIVAALVWLTSTGRQETNTPQVTSRRPLGLNNFLFISFLYLINLVLIWLRNTKSIDLDILSVSPFLLYLLSVVLGIWGIRRLVQQQEVVSFQDSGGFLYVGLALLTTLTIGYVFATANDPLIELFEDAIVYTHLAMGLAFVIYIWINFREMYRQHLPVYRVMFKPPKLELSLFRILGVFGTIVLLASGGLITIRQGIAGYYNALGDLYVATNEFNSAEAFYQLAREQEFQNHKTNYSLASLALTQGDQTAAAFFFQQALLKRPSPQAYAGLSHTYLQTNLFFESVKALQRGLKTFPASGELQNNLGYLYGRTSVADSAYYYLEAATKNADRDEVPQSNLLALYARNPKVLLANPELAKPAVNSSYESFQANALAARLVVETDTTQPEQPHWLANQPSEGLSVGRFASLYNYALANPRPDTTLTATLQRRSLDPVNQDFADDLLLARAVAEYNRHNHPDAFSLMSQLAEGNVRSGPAYRSITGLWLLEQGLYRKAAETFELNSDTVSIYYRAVALTKAGKLADAQPAWEAASVNDNDVAGIKQALYDIKRPESDLEKAIYVSYRPDDANRGAIWETIKDPNLRTVAGVSLLDQYLATRQPFYAQMILSQMAKPNQLKAYPLSVENLSALRIAVFRNKLKAAQEMAGKFFLPQHEAERQMLLGQVYARNGQSEQAKQAFDEALRLAPLNARVVTAVAQFRQQRKQIVPAYQAILAALPYNEDNPALLKTYILLCLAQNLVDYADDGLLQLELATSPADYQAFLATYQEKLALLQNDRNKFLQ
ncbi:Tetratricopeptide TPR_2 repeat protein [Fibrisoma limi BUZ 3]|uniref:Tetratricopeptide TPR_2 repeat protein n=1 Tax=Fibrisoma limi BUZ 3 TaxID=1185876 RepID=I2GSP4_9BACT|nr:tetratricopeptide repeat protein [Fibrisoma limi]CCH56923.1 Tetratricopeptide TPR_2 repeat protein [Fibrisoma limi BUZ 3]